MVFQSGMSEASACINTPRCVLVPPLPHHDLNFTAVGPYPSAQNKKPEATTLAKLSFIIPVPSLHLLLSLSSFCLHFFTFSPSCCVCLAEVPGRSPIRALCFVRARISPVQCPISENETRQSGYRNAPFLPDSLSITMMESYDDAFYCICRISELALEVTLQACSGPLSKKTHDQASGL